MNLINSISHLYFIIDYEECTDFFNVLKSDEYKERRKTEPVTYILKEGYGAHRASGLEIFDEEREY